MDILNASDDDILNATSPASFTPAAQQVTDTPGDKPVEDDTDGTETQDSKETNVTEEQQTQESTTEEDQTKEEDNTTESDTTDEVTPESQLAKLFAPFTANGKQMKIDSVEDAIKLMQMGAGFNKKMAALKPQLKSVKLLEDNKIDQERLALLIDVSKGNQAAISKLLAESNIDPLNLKVSSEYTPTTYTVSDSELELKDTLDDLKGTPHFGQVLDLVSNKLDEKSKQLLLSNPDNLRVLSDHMASGIYTKVMDRVETQRALGNLKGLSDMEAYHFIGNQMHAQNEFGTATQTAKPVANTSVATNKNEADASKLKSRKLAASPTKSTPAAKPGLNGFNPLTATDEEIANMSIDQIR